MKLKLKTILMSAKAEVLLQSKYCLNKNSVEPLTTATAAKSYVQSTFACVTAVPLRRCLSTSAESFFIIIKCHLLAVERLSWISSCSESFLTRRFLKLVIKEGLWITSLNILPKKKKWQWNILVQREIRYRDVSSSIVFLFHPSTPVIGEIDLSSPESVI